MTPPTLTIYEVKDRLENAIPDLLVAWDSATKKPVLIDKKHYTVIAYTYHKKWILKAGISEYSIHIAGIISVLEKWDGKIS